jgi:hypothetical protein
MRTADAPPTPPTAFVNSVVGGGGDASARG